MSDESVPAGTTLLLKGGQALTPDTDWHDPPRADIAIAGDRIVGVCPAYRLDSDQNVEVIDARDHLVLPGFVNAHYHSHDVLAKGTLEEVPLETWRLYALPPQYPPRSAEEVYARTLLGALECLRSGMTTIQDMLTLYPYEDRHMDAVMQAYQEVGIRVVFALQYADRKGIETIPFWKDTFPGRASSAAVDRRRAGAPTRSDRPFRDDAPQIRRRRRVSPGRSARRRRSDARRRSCGGRWSWHAATTFRSTRTSTNHAAWRCRRDCRCPNTAGS